MKAKVTELRIRDCEKALLDDLEKQGQQQNPPVKRNDWIMYQLQLVRDKWKKKGKVAA